MENLKLAYVIDTHTYADHISGGAALKDMKGCEYVMYTMAPSHCGTSRVTDDGPRGRVLGEKPVELLPGFWVFAH